MIKIGIECENLEDGQSRWGVGHLVLHLIDEYTKDLELQSKFELYLYFKKGIPKDEVLNHPKLHNQVLGTNSFNIFYHILLPWRAMRDRLDYMFFPAYMLPPFYFCKSVVMLTPDVYYEYKRGNLPFRYRLAYGLFTNWAAQKATKILAISETSKKEVAKLYDIEPTNIMVAKLGVNKIEPEHNNNYGDYILYVGQMFPRRSAKETILAFEKIAKEYPNLKLVMIGKDKYQPPIIDDLIQEINARLGTERIFHIDYLANDSEIAGLYTHAKLFVYVSGSEAFGLPPVEAATYGIPVVVKDSELNHELFKGAYMVHDPKNIDEFADIIKRALEERTIPELTSELTWTNFAKSFFKQINE